MTEELTERNQEIAERVANEPHTPLREIGEDYNISRTRVAQVAAKYGVHRGQRRPEKGEERDRKDHPIIYEPDHPRANPNGWVQKRYLVAEEKLGRPLEDEEIVIFLDEDSTNLDPDNVEVRTRSEHLRLLAQDRSEDSEWDDPAALLMALRWLAMMLERTPRNLDVNQHLPFSHVSYYNLFGSIRTAQEQAGLVPNQKGGGTEAESLPEEFEEKWNHLLNYATVEEALESEDLKTHAPAA